MTLLIASGVRFTVNFLLKTACGASICPTVIFAAPDAIPWLLVQAVGAQDGPTGGRKLTETAFNPMPDKVYASGTEHISRPKPAPDD